MIRRIEKTNWNIGLLISGAFIYFFIASQFLFCLCAIGSAKVNSLFILFSLFCIRVLIAYKRKEENNDWRIYLVLILLSPYLVELFYGC